MLHALVKSLLPLAAIGFTYQAAAQPTISAGPLAGYTRSGADYNEDRPFQALGRNGFHAGATALVGFGHLALQPGLLYTQKGFALNDDHQQGAPYYTRVRRQDEYRFNYLELPLNVVYALRADGQGFHVLAGGYVGWLLGGTAHLVGQLEEFGSPDLRYDEERPVHRGKAFADYKHYYSRAFEAGVQAGLGYRHDRALVQARYSHGLTGQGATDPAGPDPAYAHRSLQLSVAYLFTGATR